MGKFNHNHIIENAYKPYQNICSSYINYHRYYVIGEYDTKEEAIANYESDIEKWKRIVKNQNPHWYKLNYPFSYATIHDSTYDPQEV